MFVRQIYAKRCSFVLIYILQNTVQNIFEFMLKPRQFRVTPFNYIIFDTWPPRFKLRNSKRRTNVPRIL